MHEKICIDLLGNFQQKLHDTEYQMKSVRDVARTENICLWLYGPLLGLGRFFSFFIFYTVGRTPWTGGGSARRNAATYAQSGTNTE
jgi:hypothetical protein